MGVLRRAAIIAVLLASWVPAVNAQISPGELARPHKELDGMRNCLKCHELGKGPSANKCLECHQEIQVRMKQEKGYHHILVNVRGEACFACHGDHAGRNFQLVRWPNGDRDSFDHELTGWDLTGAHAKRKCRDCHKPEFIQDDLRRFRDNVDMETTFLGLHNECLDCHVDPHHDQFDVDCLKCHQDDAWKPADEFNHARTVFPLTGKHADVKCAKCHPTEGKGKKAFVRYKPVKHGTCVACHKDPHAGKLGGDCASCHITDGWMKVSKSKFDHNKTEFPLIGKHASVECERCHKESRKTQKLAFARCQDCHADFHRGEFAKRADGGRCESCHNEFGFSPALYSVADHKATKFPLEGAHLAQPCMACHGTVDEAGEALWRFRIDGSRCTKCHNDIHNGQFSAGKPNKRCEDCHNVNAWHELAFDHDRDSSYRLEGEHRTVPCSGCHKPVVVKGVRFVRYKPIDPSCANCHTREGLELRKG